MMLVISEHDIDNACVAWQCGFKCTNIIYIYIYIYIKCHAMSRHAMSNHVMSYHVIDMSCHNIGHTEAYACYSMCIVLGMLLLHGNS